MVNCRRTTRVRHRLADPDISTTTKTATSASSACPYDAMARRYVPDGSMQTLRAFIKGQGFDIKTAGRGRSVHVVREEAIAEVSKFYKAAIVIL